jgi:endonuclease/exonuclease/phosphatase family metal-dependent hydrolase
MRVTVASYNIHKAEGLDGRTDLGRIADVLREIDADIFGVQEIYQPQAEDLAASLGMAMAMGVTRHRGELPYGNAVFTRFAVQGSQTFDLSHPRASRAAASASTPSSVTACSTASTSTSASRSASARTRSRRSCASRCCTAICRGRAW